MVVFLDIDLKQWFLVVEPKVEKNPKRSKVLSPVKKSGGN